MAGVGPESSTAVGRKAKTVSLRVLTEAEEEVFSAACWYDDQLPGLGGDFLDAYEAALKRIEDCPTQFARLETTPPDVDIRRCILRRFPYLIIFELLAHETVVLAVAHASRRPDYWRGRGP